MKVPWASSQPRVSIKFKSRNSCDQPAPSPLVESADTVDALRPLKLVDFVVLMEEGRDASILDAPNVHKREVFALDMEEAFDAG